MNVIPEPEVYISIIDMGLILAAVNTTVRKTEGGHRNDVYLG